MIIKIEINWKTEIEWKTKIKTKIQIIKKMFNCNKFAIGNIIIKYNKV